MGYLINITALDVLIVVIYMVAVLGIGVYFGSKVKSHGEFFVASKKLPWWVCALAFTTVLISAHDIVSYSQTGFEAGFVAYETYLDDLGFGLLFVAVGIPIYYLSGVYTIPEFMERRFDKKTRIASSIAELLFMLALMSFNAYSIGYVLHAIWGLNILVGVLLISLATAIYTTLGGMMSVMVTDTIQSIFILSGGLYIIFAGVHAAGGIDTMVTHLPTGHRSLFTDLFDPNYPQLGMFFGGAFAITAAWYFAHQGNVQKILAARTMNQARVVTIVFFAVLMPVGVFFTGTPGIILRSLVEQGIAAAPADTGDAFIALVGIISKPGITGVILAFLMAAMMSTGSTYINSCSTVFVNDIFLQISKKKRTDRQILSIARITSTIIALVIPFLFVRYFMGIDSLMAAFYSITSAVMPGVCFAVIFGIFTKKFHSNTAFLTIIFSVAGCMLAVFIPDVFLKPFTFGLYGTPGCSWFNAAAATGWSIAGLIIGQILWHKQEKPDDAYYGLVFYAQKPSKLNDLYWEAIKKGYKGYIELSDAEIKEIVERN